MRIVKVDDAISDLLDINLRVSDSEMSQAYKDLYHNITEGLIEWLKCISVNVTPDGGEVEDEL